MNYIIKKSFVLLLLIFGLNASGQDYYRMSSDFTIKIRRADGKSNLTKGRVFYDKYRKELIYDITFPNEEKWVVKDTIIYKIRSGELYFTDEIPSYNQFTIFHLSLNSSLEYFGLKESNFIIDKVEKKVGMVISYWNIPGELQNMISSIALAKKGNQLYSVVIMDQDKQIINKQFFQDYIKIRGFEFPGTFIQIFYDENGKENYQVMEFEDIILNDSDNDEDYQFDLGRIENK